LKIDVRILHRLALGPIIAQWVMGCVRPEQRKGATGGLEMTVKPTSSTKADIDLSHLPGSMNCNRTPC
jgi:hypothetical protein